MKKILILGKDGQIGWELQQAFLGNASVYAFGREEANLANPETLVPLIRSIKPEIVINAAAYTAVDKAESEPDMAMVINGITPGILAKECEKLGSLFVHYSTDYVFNGSASRPYVEEDKTDPINVYGKSKLAGEKAVEEACKRHLIFRTSWIYSLRGKNFFLTMQKLGEKNSSIRVVNDQWGAPTWSRSVAQTTAKIVVKPSIEYGLYHMTCDGKTSWCDFARKIFAGRKTPVIIGIPSTEYPTPAQRPGYSVLSNEKLKRTFGISLPHWEVALETMRRDQ